MERFEYVSSLGEGAYGVVWLCQDRETGKQVALKRFKDAHTDPEVMRLALREVRLLKVSQHPNVVKMLEAFRSKSGRVYIAMEYIEGTLTQQMRRWHGKGFPPLLAKYLIWQLLQATQYLHNSKIMHRDFKPANILLTKDYELRVCDFGFARQLHPREVAEWTTYVVTRWYRAPEILVSDSYGPKVDVWAVGCLLCEMMGGRPLFPGKSSADQMWLTMRTLGALPSRQAALMAGDKLFAGMVPPTPMERTTLSKRFPQLSEELLGLLHGCLALDPAQRLTAEQALAHPFFADVPDTIKAIEASGRPAQEFWLDIEDAWLAAVADNGNQVCSPAFMRTSVTHSQLTSLMKRSGSEMWLNTGGEQEDDEDDDDIEESLGSMLLRTQTPTAPKHLVRRHLTSMSMSSSANLGPNFMTSMTSMAVPDGSDLTSVMDSHQSISRTSFAVASRRTSIAGPDAFARQSSQSQAAGPSSHGAQTAGPSRHSSIMLSGEFEGVATPTSMLTPPQRHPPMLDSTSRSASAGGATANFTRQPSRNNGALTSYINGLNTANAANTSNAAVGGLNSSKVATALGRQPSSGLPSAGGLGSFSGGVGGGSFNGAAGIVAPRSRLGPNSQTMAIMASTPLGQALSGTSNSTPLHDALLAGVVATSGPVSGRNTISSETPMVSAVSVQPLAYSQSMATATAWQSPSHGSFTTVAVAGRQSQQHAAVLQSGDSVDVSMVGPPVRGRMSLTSSTVMGPLGQPSMGAEAAAAHHRGPAAHAAHPERVASAGAAAGDQRDAAQSAGFLNKLKVKFKSLMSAGGSQGEGGRAEGGVVAAAPGALVAAGGGSKVVPPVADTNHAAIEAVARRRVDAVK